jgi:methyl-accepting chemotaxis protein
MPTEHIDSRYQGDLAKLSDGINTTIKQIAEAQQQQAVEKQRAEQAATEARNLADEIGRKAEADRKVAEENYRIRMALDSVSTNAMIADADGIIIYCNSAVQNLMRIAEGDIRKQLPAFNAATMLGSNFDIFHRNPNHQRNLLGSLRNTHTTEISVGGRTFRLTANPIVNLSGERLGTVLEWLDRTQEVAVEKEIEQVVSAAAAGDFSLSLRTDDKAGFFLLLSNNLNQLIEVTRNALSDIGNVLGNLAEGNLRVTMQRNYDGAFGQVQGDINRTISQLTETISGIRHAANSIAHGAREVDEGAQDLSSRTEEQAASLEETAASMEEMTQTIQQSAENARNASALVVGVQSRAQAGSVIVANAIESMDGIRIASKKIVDIVSIIDEISFQTNLLALNAAVEASRAGEHGRGFAVVASEVRNLAQHSSSAAKEIRGLINDSVDRIEQGVKLVSETGGNLNEIKSAVENASQMVENIALAVREQAVGIAEVNKAITRMEENTQQNAAMVEESSAAAANMNSQCEEMNELVGFFRV